jgi:hypothetical protein
MVESLPPHCPVHDLLSTAATLVSEHGRKLAARFPPPRLLVSILFSDRRPVVTMDSAALRMILQPYCPAHCLLVPL